MITTIEQYHTKLSKDKCIRIYLTGDIEIHIDKTDLIKNDGNVLMIFRANGNTVMINPQKIIMAQTTIKRRFH